MKMEGKKKKNIKGIKEVNGEGKHVLERRVLLTRTREKHDSLLWSWDGGGRGRL